MNIPDWKYKGFFMRYQEIHLKEAFYEKLKCPRTAITDWNPVSLIIESKLSQVGNTSCEYRIRVFISRGTSDFTDLLSIRGK